MKYQEVRQPLLVLPAYRARNQQRRCQRPLRNYSCPSHQQDIADGHIDMLPSFSGRFRMFQITPRCMKYMNYYLTICIWNINMNCMKYMKCIEYMKCMKCMKWRNDLVQSPVKSQAIEVFAQDLPEQKGRSLRLLRTWRSSPTKRMQFSAWLAFSACRFSPPSQCWSFLVYAM